MFTIRYMKCGRKWQVVVHEGFYCIEFESGKHHMESEASHVALSGCTCMETLRGRIGMREIR